MHRRRAGIPVCAVLVIAVLGISGCGMKEKEPGRYYNKAGGFSIRFPEGWDIDEEEEDGMIIVTALSPVEGELDMYYEGISVSVEKIGKWSLDRYFNDVQVNSVREIGIKTAGTGYDVVDDVSARWMVGTYKMEEDGLRIKALGYCMVKGSKGYLIICDAEEHRFDTYRDNYYNAVIKTFRFE